MPFKFEHLQIPDLVLITAHSFADNRGYFLETYKHSEFAENGINANFLQDNFSHSTHGVLRGLHFQTGPYAQAKLVKVLRGAIFDVAVDIRPKSPTYGQWVGLELTDQEHQMFYIPEGFAHGFYVESNSAVFNYKCTESYHPDDEYGINWNDSELNLGLVGKELLVSEKDQLLPKLKNIDQKLLPTFN